MRRTRLDDRTADRLLAGNMTAEDAPAGFSAVADLLHEARPPEMDPTSGTAASDAATIAEMAAVIVRQRTAVPRGPVATGTAARAAAAVGARRPSRRITTKVVGLAAVATLVGVGTAAAATGSLPAP